MCVPLPLDQILAPGKSDALRIIHVPPACGIGHVVMLAFSEDADGRNAECIEGSRFSRRFEDFSLLCGVEIDAVAACCRIHFPVAVRMKPLVEHMGQPVVHDDFRCDGLADDGIHVGFVEGLPVNADGEVDRMIRIPVNRFSRVIDVQGVLPHDDCRIEDMVVVRRVFLLRYRDDQIPVMGFPMDAICTAQRGRPHPYLVLTSLILPSEDEVQFPFECSHGRVRHKDTVKCIARTGHEWLIRQPPKSDPLRKVGRTILRH